MLSTWELRLVYRGVPRMLARNSTQLAGVGSAEAFVAGEVAEVTDVVVRLAGHRPRSFAAFARELRAAA